jgi:hypothetical protein
VKNRGEPHVASDVTTTTPPRVLPSGTARVAARLDRDSAIYRCRMINMRFLRFFVALSSVRLADVLAHADLSGCSLPIDALSRNFPCALLQALTALSVFSIRNHQRLALESGFKCQIGRNSNQFPVRQPTTTKM